MSKPRIIILMHYLELGGAEMALIGLLQALNPEKVDVDLFLYCHRGPLMQFIPDWINLLPEVGCYSVIEAPLKEALQRGYFGIVYGRLMSKWKHKQYRMYHSVKGDDGAIMQYVGEYVTPHLSRINDDVEYDLCISFLTPHHIGLSKIRAKQRLAWIHTDYSTVDIDVERESTVWGAYDKIVSISPEVTKSFLARFPGLASKIIQIENIIPSEYVLTRSSEFSVHTDVHGDIILLSIGRYCLQKNFDNVPDIARRIVDAGFSKLKWYIIGYGGDEQLIRKKIAEAKMEKHVIMLGKKANPYPYIKACDIYVQPSRYEGKSVTVREAQILQKPVVITNYPTAKSQITDGVDGVIVPLDNEGCAQGIANFIVNIPLQEQIIANLRKGDFSKMAEVHKLYSLLE